MRVRLPAWSSWAVSALALAALFASCREETSASAPTQEVLLGTWLREYTDRSARVRRVLTLQPDGTFREAVRAVDAGGAILEHRHEGHWFWDGTNLKRKYTLVDGEPPSRLNVPFATFQVTFDSRDEFHGVDHIRRHRVRYHRVAADTRP